MFYNLGPGLFIRGTSDCTIFWCIVPDVLALAVHLLFLSKSSNKMKLSAMDTLQFYHCDSCLENAGTVWYTSAA